MRCVANYGNGQQPELQEVSGGRNKHGVQQSLHSSISFRNCIVLAAVRAEPFEDYEDRNQTTITHAGDAFCTPDVRNMSGICDDPM